MAAVVGARDSVPPKTAGGRQRNKRVRHDTKDEPTETASAAEDCKNSVSPDKVTLKIEPVEKKPKKEVDSDNEGVANEDKSINEEWKSTEIVLLLDQIQTVMPNDDNIKYSTMAEKLEWEKVSVEGHSAAECKEQWLHITTKLRRFRTMSELLIDAKQWAKHPWNAFGKKTTKHPEMPKKPLTPYFRFFMRKRVSYAKKHPDMSVTELTKELSKKYGALSERKKRKYIDSYNKDMELWKTAMVKFRQEHPEAFNDDSGNGCSSNVLLKQFGFTGPPKTITAVQIYINEKCEEERKKGSKVARKELYEKYKSAWQSLSDTKKLKYIKLAMEAKKKYDEDIAKYCLEHPDFQPRVVKTFLSKAEQKIKDKVDGKPEKPPSNGYSLFTIETLPLLSSMPNNERLGEVSRRWKKLSEDKKEAYNLKAEERNQEYKRAYSKYLLSLPDDVRKRLEKEDVDKQNTKKKVPQPVSLPSSSQTVNTTMDRPLKPVADVFMFIEDKKSEYKKKYPQMDENELHRFMVKEFNCISERDKAKYKKMAEQERERLAKESAQSVNSSLKRAKRVPFPGEPAKPSHSGYQLFSREMLVQLREVKANERLQEIGRRWAALTDTERQHWNKRKDTMWVQYRKQLAKFKKGLSAKELKRFEELNTPAKKKKKAKKEEPADNVTTSEEETSNDDEIVKTDVVVSNDSDSDYSDNEQLAVDSKDVVDHSANEAADADGGDNEESEEEDEEEDENDAVDAVESDSEADEEAAEQLAKKLLQDNSTGASQGNSSRLDASQVYNDSSDSSSDESSSSDSS